MAGLDISGVLSAVSDMTAQLPAAKTSTQTSITATQTAASATSDLYDTIGSNNAVITAAQQAAKLSSQAAGTRAAAQLGTDLDDVSGRYSDAQDAYLSAVQSRSAALDAVKQKQNVKLWDNPIQWLMNQASIDDDIEAFNTANADVKMKEQNIEVLNNLTDQRVQSARNLEAPITQASAKAATDNAAALQNIEAQKALRQGAIDNISGIQSLQSLNKDSIYAASSGVQAQYQKTQLGIALQDLDLKKQEFDLSKQKFSFMQEEHQERMDALADKKSFDDYIVGNLQKGWKTLYPDADPLPITGLSNKWQLMAAGKLPMDPKLQEAYSVGVMNAGLPDSSRLLATSPFEALKLQQLQVPVGEGAKPTLSFIQGASAAFQKTPEWQQLQGSKDPTAMKQAFNNFAIKQYENQVNTRAQDPTSLAYIPGLDTIAKSNPNITGMPTYQAVFADSKARLDQPELAVNMALNAVSDGKISLNQAAADMSAMYMQGVRLNNANKQLTNMGIPEDNRYMINGVDYANKDALTRQMMKTMGRMMTGQMFGNYGGVE
jgi:hypothetical protein